MTSFHTTVSLNAVADIVQCGPAAPQTSEGNGLMRPVDHQAAQLVDSIEFTGWLLGLDSNPTPQKLWGQASNPSVNSKRRRGRRWAQKLGEGSPMMRW
jgi:hypothetical protein